MKMKLSPLLVVATAAGFVNSDCNAQESGVDDPCIFCDSDGQEYLKDPILRLSTSGIDRVTCEGLLDLLASGLSTTVCENEKEIIETTCCRDVVDSNSTNATTVVTNDVLLDKCVCYAHDGADCPVDKAPDRLKDELTHLYRTNDRHVCSGGYAQGCRYSANNLLCSETTKDSDTYNVHGVIYCEVGCAPIPAPKNAKDDAAAVDPFDDLPVPNSGTSNFGTSNYQQWGAWLVSTFGVLTAAAM